MRHFLDLVDISPEDLRLILKHAASLKADQIAGGTAAKLQGKTLAMIFEKHSTRTRVSFDLAMRQLGGYAMELDRQNSQMGRGENIADTTRVLSRYVDVIMVRAHHHTTALEMAKVATVPVINGLTDHSHPCQIMADILTFEEHKGQIAGKTLAWVGDANNVCTSFIQAAVLLGFHLRIATPKAYEPSEAVLTWAKGHETTGSITCFSKPEEAVAGADAVITDTWISMGDSDPEKKKTALRPYQVTAELITHAAKDAIFMHCLPATRGEEVSAEVIDSKASVVLDEAENRLHVQKAILLWCLKQV
jgi:ornithine carbamoyltransferase